MNLEKRVEQLEHRIGKADDEFVLMVICALGCDPDKLGAERAIHYPVVGYSAIGCNRKWLPAEGESIAALKERMEKELRSEGHKVFAVAECYEGA